MKTKLAIGFSPCPNDTFIFCDLVNGKISDLPFNIEYVIADVEQLNRMAQDKRLDVVKTSVASYPNLSHEYAILTSGGALTWKDGPIVVSKQPLSMEEFRHTSIAIPGKGTTAAMLLDIFNLHEGPRHEMLFSDIMPAVRDGFVNAGVVIHEGRWTYQSYGLVKILDLGELWNKTFEVPLPLGIIAIKRTLLTKGYGQLINEALRNSILYARSHRSEVYHFIEKYASEMGKDIVDKHIDAFVNEFSEDLGIIGRRAVYRFVEEATKNKKIRKPTTLFWDETRIDNRHCEV
ncbi:MAG: 1,4-dihydroxy-6-naphthoate synthase [Thermodesulforhabdaceae bacterium]